MASSKKTDNLGLSYWELDDAPKMADFVTDNMIIDSILGNHINNDQIHLSSEDRELLGGSIESIILSGDGTSSRTVTLSKTPKMVQVFLKNSPPASWDSAKSCMVINSAFALQNGLSSGGASLSGNKLVLVENTAPSNGIMYNLNQQYGQYIIVSYN